MRTPPRERGLAEPVIKVGQEEVAKGDLFGFGLELNPFLDQLHSFLKG
ncbi:MAG: hypothetical protein QHH14_12905 [Clostridiales bacterium]|nr:hypothetical protein [Clostridiales bacterium]